VLERLTGSGLGKEWLWLLVLRCRSWRFGDSTGNDEGTHREPTSVDHVAGDGICSWRLGDARGYAGTHVMGL
jgi:hypothetical protein